MPDEKDLMAIGQLIGQKPAQQKDEILGGATRHKRRAS